MTSQHWVLGLTSSSRYKLVMIADTCSDSALQKQEIFYTSLNAIFWCADGILNIGVLRLGSEPRRSVGMKTSESAQPRNIQLAQK